LLKRHIWQGRDQDAGCAGPDVEQNLGREGAGKYA